MFFRSRSFNNYRETRGPRRSRSRSNEGRFNGGNRGPPRGDYNGNGRGDYNGNQGSFMMPENRNDMEQGGPADMNRPPPNMPSSKF